jgi:hypothetical protein
MPEMRIVVVIDGGCLRCVLCDDPEAEVELIDMDNARYQDEDGEEEAEKRIAELYDEMTEVA